MLIWYSRNLISKLIDYGECLCVCVFWPGTSAAHPLAWLNRSLMKVWINYHYLQLAWASWTCLQFKRRAINSAQLLPSDIPTQRTRNTHTLRFSNFLPSCKKMKFCVKKYDSALMPSNTCALNRLFISKVCYTQVTFSQKKCHPQSLCIAWDL